MSPPFDAVVVGAGFAGLAAAEALEAAGCRIAILEALDRPGGRAETVPGADGRPWDAGAQFINGDMRRVLALARRFRLGLVAAPVGGRPALHAPGAGEGQKRLALAEAEAFEAAVPAAHVPAGLSLADLVAAERLSPLGRATVRSAIAELTSTAPEEVSAAWAAAGEARYGSDRDDVEFVLREGFGGLALALAGALRAPPMLGTPALGLSVEGSGVSVATPHGPLAAPAAVLALPLPVAARLPMAGVGEAVRASLAAWRAGAVVKLALRYAEPFWRYGGYSGTLRSALHEGLWAGDTSSGEGATLTVLAGGPLASRLAAMTAPERLGFIASVVSETFAGALPPLSADERVWAGHPTLGGGYSAHLAPGSPLSSEASLAAGEGPVLFAGTDLGAEFPGFVEGALASGEAAAARVLARLGGARPPARLAA